MPIKGMDLAYRLWPGAEYRPTSDLDVLVPYARFSEARTKLVEAGWVGLGQRPVDEEYLHAEGYNWQARNEAGSLLELHFRLWPSTPAAWVDAVWAGSSEAPEIGKLARLPSWADAFQLCAVHLWQLPPPHALLYFRELELIARRLEESDFAQVSESSRRWGLSLQVGLASTYVVRLWQNPAVQRLASVLQAALRPPEKLLLTASVARGIDVAPLGALYVARLLSGRETRHGWKVAFRRLRPHPALRPRPPAADPGRVRKTNEP